MAIVKMSKFTLLTFGEERGRLLHELQKFQYIHFQDLNKNEELVELGLHKIEVPERIASVNEEINKVKFSIDVLSRYREKQNGIQALKEGMETLDFNDLEEKAQNIQYEPIYENIRSLVSKQDEVTKEIEKIKAEIDELSPWRKLDVPFQLLTSFTQCQTFIGTIPKKRQEAFQEDMDETNLTTYEVVHTDQEHAYVVVLTHKSCAEEIFDCLKRHSFARVSFSYKGKPGEEIAALEANIADLQNEKKEVVNSIKELSRHLHDFEIVYEYLMNKKIRIAAQENFLKTEHIDVIEGYIPTDMEQEFSEIVKKELRNIYYLELEEADKDDPDVPILLKNSRFSKAFESLTSMYALPKYNEIDPTPLFSTFYCIFFGMMAADFGYGLLLWLGTFTVLKFFNLKEEQKQFIRFFYYVSYATMFWGLIFGSFLGGVIELPYLINPAEDYLLLLYVAIGIGIIHIFYALGIQGYMALRDGRPLDALFDVGFWYLLLGGAIIYLVGMFVSEVATYETIAVIAMVIGAVGIVLTGGRDAKTFGGKLASGLYSLYGVSSYVGDFVSYSRLMALGLSGGFIASAINLMVRMLFSAGFIGIIFGIIVFIVGQSFNIFLSCLSAYVHSIRLTYVEFFGKFYEGGGKAFRLFRSQPKYINIKE